MSTFRSVCLNRQKAHSRSAIAYFVTPHGFGHAARSAAVIEALWQLRPGSRVEIFTTVPEWFFSDSLGESFGYHLLDNDLGMIQRNALEEDAAATAAELGRRLPFADELLAALATRLLDLDCNLVVADIAPLGLAVAHRAGLKAALVENFTWDWIYRGFADRQSALLGFADLLGKVFDSADYRFQTAPFCAAAPAGLPVGPVSRRRRWDRARVRRELGIPAQQPMVLVTMGGLSWQHAELTERDTSEQGPWIVIPGGSDEPERHGRRLLLPHRSRFYHPDLIGAADAVIGKLGYSTVAEVYRAGIPLGYVPRHGFPESARLEAWVRQQMSWLEIDLQDFRSGGWVARLGELLALPRYSASLPDGAEQIAAVLSSLLPPLAGR